MIAYQLEAALTRLAPAASAARPGRGKRPGIRFRVALIATSASGDLGQPHMRNRDP
jgi:hypothetical protein